MSFSKPSANGHVFVIAEAGVNHNGNRDLAFGLIEAAAYAGADAVKFQTFEAAKLSSSLAPKASYQLETTEKEETQLDMLRALELPFEWHSELKSFAHDKGLEFMSTAFDPESLDFLLELGLSRIKVPSGELCNGPLLIRYAQSGLPLILSTGMASLGEIELALAITAFGINHHREPESLEVVWRDWSHPERRAAIEDRVALLHCTSQYPADMSSVNLSAMDSLRVFGLPVGYSDHTDGLTVPIAAVAKGATIIEKHFTLDRSLPGPDHLASLEPDQLKEMIDQIRDLRLALGDGCKFPQPGEWNTRLAARQTVVATCAIAQGEVLTRAMLGTARCGGGVPGTGLWDMVGRTTSRGYLPGEAITP